MMTTTAELFHALGDPIRIEIVQRLATDMPHSISSIAENLPISRQGTRKHLQVLANAKIIHLHSQGRSTAIQIDFTAIEQAKLFIEQLETQWDSRLTKLQHLIDTENKQMTI